MFSRTRVTFALGGKCTSLAEGQACLSSLMNHMNHILSAGAQAVNGVKVVVSHPNKRTYRVTGLSDVPARNDFFDHDELGRVRPPAPTRYSTPQAPLSLVPMHLVPLF